MSRKRFLTIFAVLAIVVAVAAVSWIAGSSIQSPAEAAARTAPPTPSPILVPVEERVLTSDVVTRGTARYGLPQEITLVPSSLKADVGLVTTLPARDTQLNEGDLLLTVSGRPVFLLQGEIPIYRDFLPGHAGEDVLQLEFALQRLAFDPGPIDGTYDEQTSTAVSDWYTSQGWQSFAATPAQHGNIRALEQQLAAARQDEAGAEAAAEAAPLAVEVARAEAQATNKLAQNAVAAAGADDLEAAQAAAQAAELAGELAIQQALDAQELAQRQAQTAVSLVEQLTADLQAAQRDAGVKVPADEIVFLPDLPVRVEQNHADIGDRAGGPILTVTNNQLAIDSSLPLDEAPLVKAGLPVAIDEPDLGFEATGTVQRVALTPGTDGVDGFHIYFETLVDETPDTLEGFSLRLTIPVQSTAGSVLVVPISALSLAADGTTRIQVEENGQLQFLAVEPGLSADGFVEVNPLDGSLTPGQLVLIGYDQES